MKRIILILMTMFFMASGYSQVTDGDFDMIDHQPDKNIQLSGMNCWIDKTTLGNWITIVEGNYYKSNTFAQALQVFYTTKLKKVREFTLNNTTDTLVEVTYDKESLRYKVVLYNNEDNPYYFNSFHGNPQDRDEYDYPVSVRGFVRSFLMEAVTEELLYYTWK